MDDDISTAPVSIAINKVVAGSADEPAISMGETSGWFLGEDGEIKTVVNGREHIIYSHDYIEIKLPFLFHENLGNTNVVEGKGLLYMKIEDDELYWKNINGEVCLSKKIANECNENIRATINEVDETINETIREVENKVNNHIDVVDSKFVEVENKVNNHIDVVDSKFVEVENKVNNRIDVVDSKFVEVENKVNNRIDVVDSKFVEVENKVNEVNSKFVEVENKVNEVNSKFVEVENKVNETNTRITNLMHEIDTELDELENKMDIKLSHIIDEVDKKISSEKQSNICDNNTYIVGYFEGKLEKISSLDIKEIGEYKSGSSMSFFYNNGVSYQTYEIVSGSTAPYLSTLYLNDKIIKTSATSEFAPNNHIVKIIAINNDVLVAYKLDDILTLRIGDMTKSFDCAEDFSVSYDNIYGIVLFINGSCLLLDNEFNEVCSKQLFTWSKCESVAIPGNIIVFAGDNKKTFVILSDNEITEGNVIIDNDSVNCVQLIYDDINAVIVSADTTYASTIMLNIIDIFGTTISLLYRKKLREHMTDVRLLYNGTYALFYDNKVRFFTCESDTIKMGHEYNVSFEHVYVNGSLYVCLNNVIYRLSKSRVQPDDFVGVYNGSLITKGNICIVNIGKYLGKKVYIDVKNIEKEFPNNLTSIKEGNEFFGTVLTENSIIIGI